MARWLDEGREKADKPRTLELLRQFNARIAELNVGSSRPPPRIARGGREPLTPATGRVPKRRARYETIAL